MDYVTKKKKKNDWEEDVCCRTYMGVWMEKFITVNFSQKTVSSLARFKYRSLARSLCTPLSMETTLYVMIFFKCDETGDAKPSLTDLIHNWDITLLLFHRDKPFRI